MIKCDKGMVEIEGFKSEIIAEFGVLYKSIREDIEKEDIMKVIDYMEEKINNKDEKEKLIELLNKLFD